MKTKRYSTEQIIGILKEAEAGKPVKELCRNYGVSDATIFNRPGKPVDNAYIESLNGSFQRSS